MLLARVSSGGFTEPTLIGVKLIALDLAGNAETARVTALFSPPGFPDGMISINGGITIDSAELTANQLKAPNGTSYTAPHVWQNQITAIDVCPHAYSLCPVNI
jgi:hypothetical protein